MDQFPSGEWITFRAASAGSKSERGTQVAATFYSLIETAKLCGVAPAAYLRAAALADARDEVLLPADFVGA